MSASTSSSARQRSQKSLRMFLSSSIATGNKREALRRDMECMLHFPGDFGCFDLLQCTADKQSTISVKGCQASYVHGQPKD